MEPGDDLAEHDRLVLDDLPDEIRAAAQAAGGARSGGGRPDGGDGQAEAGPLLPLEAVTRRHIERVLASVGGNKSLAAQILGVDRSTLYRKLEGRD